MIYIIKGCIFLYKIITIIIFIAICLPSSAKDVSRQLYDAIRKGNIETAKNIVENGFDINGKNEVGGTPIIWASEANQIEFVEYLISKGADVNAKNNIHYTPLHWASIYNLEKIIELLVKNGADLEALAGISSVSGEKYKNTPLHFAARKGNFEAVEILIENGANINAKDFRGFTPLFYSAYNAKFKVVEFLLSKGADVNAKSKKKRFPTPIYKGIGSRDMKTVQLLVEFGADLKITNKNGLNPYEFAIRTRRKKIAEYLRKEMEKQTGKKIKPKTVNPGKYKFPPRP